MHALIGFEGSPSPSSITRPIRGFDLLDYILCGAYFLLTLYVSARSAFRKTEGIRERGSRRISSVLETPDDSKSLLGSSEFDVCNTEVIPKTSDVNSSDDSGDVAEKYFFAGRTANKVMVAVSLLSGLTSGISFVGIPSYVYANGAGMFVVCLSQPIGGCIVAYLIMPFYFKIRLSTPYAYLESRFSKSIRTAAAILFMLRVSFYLAVVLQAPAILLQQSGRVPPWITVSISGMFATLFTMKGGMKTVILTDFMQSITLLGGAIVACIFAVAGSLHSNPPGVISEDVRLPWGRYLSIDSWSLDNVWYLLVGSTFSYVAGAGTDQIVIQRLMSTTNLLEARRASIYSGLLNGFITLLLACTGLYIHAFYRGKGYDPTAGDPNSNKIMFIFLLEYSIPGLVGVVFSAVLGSTISVVCGGLNAAATSFYVDILQNVYGWTTTPTQVVFVSRIVTAGFGVFVTLIAVFSTMLRMDIVNFSNSVSGLFGGPVCAVFLCGMFTKVVNTNGIALGVGVAFMILLYVAIGDVACQHIDSPDICNNGFLYYSRVNPWMISFWLGLSTAGFGLGFSYLLQSTSSTRNQQVLEEDL